MKRRTFLAFLGLAPAAPLAAKIPLPAPVARAADILTYPATGWFNAEKPATMVFTRGTFAYYYDRDGIIRQV